MRISTRQTYLTSVQNMQNSQSKLADLQNQISTGKKLQKPSDDPVAAAQVVKLNRELAQIDKYQDNIDVSQRRLELEETVLDNLHNTNNRIRELTLQAGNSTLSDADRKTIAFELRGLVDHAAGLMNTQDSQGEYLFAGSKGFDQPYVKDSVGNYSYTGDDGQRLIQVAPELFVPSNDSGRYLFNAATSETTINVLPDTPVYLSEFEVKNEEQFAEFTKGKGDLTFEVVLDTQAAVPTYNYQLRDSDGNVVVEPQALPAFGSDLPINIEGLSMKVAQPTADALIVEPQVSGIKEITVADPVAAKALHDANGDLTITFDTSGPTPQYSITNGAGDPVAIDGSTGPFDYTPNQDLVVGGFRLDIGDPQNTNALTFGLPLSDLSSVSKVTVTDVAQFTAATADIPTGHGELSVRFNMPGQTYDLLDGDNNVLRAAVDFSATPNSIALEHPVGTGLGMSLTVGTPTDGETVKLKVPAHTETTLRPEQKRQDILSVATELATALEKPVENDEQRKELSETLSKGLVKIDQISERNLEARTTIGSRVNSLEDTKTSNEDFRLYTKTALSSLEDVDFAEAISELKLEEAILQAAQASFVRIQELSLFNFIR